MVFFCRAEDEKGIKFSARPYGEATKATRIDEQKGHRLKDTVSPTNFEELTIAQGSGLDGFDAIRIFSNGSGYAVFSNARDRNRKVAIKLSEKEMGELIASLNADKVAQIMGLYSAGWNDGTQGFVEIKTKEGRRYCWLDNHFDPVSNIFEYCNKVIWPKISSAKIEEKGIDRQAEYYRVFHPEKQNKPE